MRAITFFVMLLVITMATGCSDSTPPTETKPLGAHRVPGRTPAATRPTHAAQP
jgi:hypothetical protein